MSILTDYDINIEMQKIANRAAEQVLKNTAILEAYSSAKDFGKSDAEAMKYAAKNTMSLNKM